MTKDKRVKNSTQQDDTNRGSDTLVCKWRVVCPTYDAEQHRYLNNYTTPVLINLGSLSLKGKKEKMRVEESTCHSGNFDDFEILSSCFDTCELMIYESLLIFKLKPSLNVQGSSIPLNLL